MKEIIIRIHFPSIRFPFFLPPFLRIFLLVAEKTRKKSINSSSFFILLISKVRFLVFPLLLRRLQIKNWSSGSRVDSNPFLTNYEDCLRYRQKVLLGVYLGWLSKEYLILRGDIRSDVVGCTPDLYCPFTR